MCEFFSCIAVRDGRLLFTNSNHHSDIIQRAGLRDTEVFLREFVRLECVPPFENVRVDEEGTLPGWFDPDDWQARVVALAQRVAPLYADYEAKRAPLDADYGAKRDALDADYQAKRAPLDADYEAKYAPLCADYGAKLAALDADYGAELARIDGYIALD